MPCWTAAFLSVRGAVGHGKSPSVRRLGLPWAVAGHFLQTLQAINNPEEVPCVALGVEGPWGLPGLELGEVGQASIL